MIELLYGTSNLAKLTSMKHMIKSLNVSLINNNSLDLSKIEIDENGDSPLENAKIKALAFYDAFALPVFSCDTGLYFRNVEDKYQPGVRVRRINGKYLNDEEMIEYYSALAKSHDGQLIAYYKNAICLVIDKNQIYSYDGESIHSEEFIISSHPHTMRTEGYPLDSLSIHKSSGKYYMDLRADTAHSYVLKKDLSQGFANFFIDSIGAKNIL